MKRFRYWLPCLGLAIGLSACGGGAAPNSAPAVASSGAAATGSAAKPSEPAGSSAAKPSVSAASASPAVSVVPGKFNFAFTQVTATFLPLFFAQDAGVFQKHGLDVNVTLTQSVPGMAALLSGQIEMSLIGGTELMNAASQGGDVVALANIVPVYTYLFEVQPSIKSGQDLKGKRVGITQFGSTIDVATRVALGKVGLTAKDVDIVQLSSASARSDALLNGSIQAGLSNPPDSLVLEAHGLHPLVDLATAGAPATTALVVSRRSWVAAHRDQTQQAVDSMVEAIARLKVDETQAIAILKKWLKYDDQNGLKATYEFYAKNVFPALPYAEPAQFKDVLAASTDPKVKGFDPNTALDSSFVKSAEDRGLAKA